MRVFVVVDLKMRAFELEFARKMNFYLSAVNDLLRHSDDQPGIGNIGSWQDITSEAGRHQGQASRPQMPDVDTQDECFVDNGKLCSCHAFSAN